MATTAVRETPEQLPAKWQHNSIVVDRRQQWLRGRHRLAGGMNLGLDECWSSAADESTEADIERNAEPNGNWELLLL